MVTLPDRIELVGSNGRLVLASDERGWTRVSLKRDGMSLSLGAERLGGIATKLVAFLTQHGPGARWVLSLSELHFSVYGEHFADKVVLLIQDGDAQLVAELQLTPSEQQEWIDRLRSLIGPPR